MSPPALAAVDLVQHYPTAEGLLYALRGVSLEVMAGETLGLVGESGAGKSTLARLLVGLEAPRAGAVRLLGRDLSELRRAERRAVQLVFQDPGQSLNPRQSVGAALAEPLRVHGLVPKAELAGATRALLEEVRLPAALLERWPHTLSGGERQRLALARALSVRPAVLVLDEPISSLDLPTQEQILELLAELQRRHGLALVLISHDLSALARRCARLAVLYAGRIVEEGPASEVLGGPRHPYTRALVAATPRLDGPGTSGLPGDPPSPLAPPAGCAFHPRCPLTVERCRAEAPRLGSPDPETAAGRHPVACHRV